MNGILALLISEEFCVETVIVKHTSFLALFPPALRSSSALL